MILEDPGPVRLDRLPAEEHEEASATLKLGVLEDGWVHLSTPFEPLRLPPDTRGWYLTFDSSLLSEDRPFSPYFYWVCRPLFSAFVAGEEPGPLRLPGDAFTRWRRLTA